MPVLSQATRHKNAETRTHGPGVNTDAFTKQVGGQFGGSVQHMQQSGQMQMKVNSCRRVGHVCGAQ